MIGGRTTSVNITLSGELKAKGRDLVYTLSKENFNTDVLGG
jgi:LEA14-like dessication related protein